MLISCASESNTMVLLWRSFKIIPHVILENALNSDFTDFSPGFSI